MSSLYERIIKAVNEENIEAIGECLKEFENYNFKRMSFFEKE